MGFFIYGAYEAKTKGRNEMEQNINDTENRPLRKGRSFFHYLLSVTLYALNTEKE
jgi:hypothetical protein